MEGISIQTDNNNINNYKAESNTRAGKQWQSNDTNDNWFFVNVNKFRNFLLTMPTY